MDDIAPDSVMSFIACSCQKGCTTNRCSCKRASLKCSDLCRCKGCENSELGEQNEIDYVELGANDSDDTSDSSSDESEVDEDDDANVTSEWETSILESGSD